MNTFDLASRLSKWARLARTRPYTRKVEEKTDETQKHVGLIAYRNSFFVRDIASLGRDNVRNALSTDDPDATGGFRERKGTRELKEDFRERL
jgi:hypothetical protein